MCYKAKRVNLLLSGGGRSLGAKISGGRDRAWGIFFGFYKTRHILLSDSANCTVLRAVVLTQYRELRTLRTQDTSDSGHFGTSLVGPNCPDRSALVPKCPKDSSDLLSAELSCPKCRTVPSQVPKGLDPCLTTIRCNRPKGQINRITLKGIEQL